MQVPRNLEVLVSRLAGYKKNRIRVVAEGAQYDAVAPGATSLPPAAGIVTLSLPTNGVIDLESLNLFFEVNVLGSVSGQLFGLPRFAEQLIGRIVVTVGGVRATHPQGGDRYADIFTLEQNAKGTFARCRGSSTLMNGGVAYDALIGPTVTVASSCGSTVHGCTVGCSGLLGFLQGKYQRFLDLSLLPRIQLEIEQGPQTSCWTDPSTIKWNLTNFRIYADEIEFGDATYHALMQSLLNKGPIEIPFANYACFTTQTSQALLAGTTAVVDAKLQSETVREVIGALRPFAPSVPFVNTLYAGSPTYTVTAATRFVTIVNTGTTDFTTLTLSDGSYTSLSSLATALTTKFTAVQIGTGSTGGTISITVTALATGQLSYALTSASIAGQSYAFYAFDDTGTQVPYASLNLLGFLAPPTSDINVTGTLPLPSPLTTNAPLVSGIVPPDIVYQGFYITKTNANADPPVYGNDTIEVTATYTTTTGSTNVQIAPGYYPTARALAAAITTALTNVTVGSTGWSFTVTCTISDFFNANAGLLAYTVTSAGGSGSSNATVYLTFQNVPGAAYAACGFSQNTSLFSLGVYTSSTKYSTYPPPVTNINTIPTSILSTESVLAGPSGIYEMFPATVPNGMTNMPELPLFSFCSGSGPVGMAKNVAGLVLAVPPYNGQTKYSMTVGSKQFPQYPANAMEVAAIVRSAANANGLNTGLSATDRFADVNAFLNYGFAFPVSLCHNGDQVGFSRSDLISGAESGESYVDIQFQAGPLSTGAINSTTTQSSVYDANGYTGVLLAETVSRLLVYPERVVRVLY